MKHTWIFLQCHKWIQKSISEVVPELSSIAECDMISSCLVTHNIFTKGKFFREFFSVFKYFIQILSYPWSITSLNKSFNIQLLFLVGYFKSCLNKVFELHQTQPWFLNLIPMSGTEAKVKFHILVSYFSLFTCGPSNEIEKIWQITVILICTSNIKLMILQWWKGWRLQEIH